MAFQIPNNVVKVGSSIWLDVREQETRFQLVTLESAETRPTLLPNEVRIPEAELREYSQRLLYVIVICSQETKNSLSKELQDQSNILYRVYSPERLLRRIPRNVNVWIQWFPHSQPARAQEFQEAFVANCECPSVSKVYQLSERSYENVSFLAHPKANQVSHPERVSFNSFFKIVKEYPSENEKDIHVLMNADMEWTEEASLGLEQYLWELETSVISPLRWEDQRTLFGNRPDSQDVWGFQQKNLPDHSKMMVTIPLGKPGCDNRILMELMVQGFTALNRPLQFPTLHHHKTNIRNYTSKDQIPRPYLMTRLNGYMPLVDVEPESWIVKAGYNLRNRIFPELPDEVVSTQIRRAIETGRPFAIGKVGQAEADTVMMCFELNNEERKSFGIRVGQYTDKVLREIGINAGVFPVDRAGLDAFARQYQYAAGRCDILSKTYSWLILERGEEMLLCAGGLQNQPSCKISATEPFFQVHPFTQSLHQRKVAVISPFTETMKSQLSNKSAIWGDRVSDFLPDAHWKFIRCPLSAGLVSPVDESWGAMVARLTKECFPPEDESSWPDVVLCGCGPAGLCIAEEAKTRGKVGISMGGSLQLLFGIRGKRWDENAKFQKFFNDAWVRPSQEETPPTSKAVEQGCYW
jgi:hypothetical protein